MENWDSPPLHYFRKLKLLIFNAHTNSSVNSLEKLLGLEKVNGDKILHVTGGETFPLLRVLCLYGMRKLTDLGDDSLGPTKLYFPNVEVLELIDCDSLMSLRSSAISFINLTTLEVSRCKGLKYLISFSVAKSLMQLTTLQVRDCEKMIEIVACSGNDDSGNEIEFKLLKHLELSDLPCLRGFCSTTRIIKFSSLEKLLVTSCAQLEGFIFKPTDKSTLGSLGNHVQDTNSNGNTEAEGVPHFLFDNKAEFPRLTSLTLKGLTKLSAIWNKQVQDSSVPPKSFECEYLEYVEIDSCENLENIFPLSVARNLQQLKTLKVKNCGVTEIVAREDGLQTILKFVFPKVTGVLFQKLPKLINFYPGSHICSWPLLNELRVFECDKVDILFAEEILRFQEKKSSSSLIDRQSLFFVDKDSFPNLERLSVIAREFSNGPLPSTEALFGKLKKLFVFCSESTSLVFLGKLLLHPAEGNNTAGAVGIRYPQFPYLKELGLVGMEKLMCLGKKDEDDNSQSSTHIPNIPNLQILLVNACHTLKNLRSSAVSFNNLTTLRVSVCHGLEYLITYSMANSLRQLTTLEVESCWRLVQIVGSNGDDNSRNEITFPKLQTLKLSDLPNLRSFCSGNCIAKLPSMKTATMSNRLKFKIFAHDNQTLQLITSEGEDTSEDENTNDGEVTSEGDVTSKGEDTDDYDKEEPTAENEMNSASTELISQ